MTVFERFLYKLLHQNYKIVHIESSLLQIMISDVWTRKDPEEHLKGRRCWPPNLVSLGKSSKLHWMRTQRKPACVQVYHSLAR